MTSGVVIARYRGQVRASRLVGLLGLLQARGRMTAGQLAGELEVSVRTVLRDIEALSDAGIPVYAVRGSLGGFELLDGFHSDLPATMPGLTRPATAPPAGPPAGPQAGPPDVAPAGPGAGRARILLSPRGRRLAALLGRPAGLRIRRSTGAVSGTRDPAAGPGEVAGRAGWAQAWMQIASVEAAVLDLLALGAEAEVIHPPGIARPGSRNGTADSRVARRARW
jgi:hypothetical protein